MIIYLTKETMKRYNLEDEEVSGLEDNSLMRWGGKVFNFERRKCLQLCNFASRFTLFLFCAKKKDVLDLDQLIPGYLFML